MSEALADLNPLARPGAVEHRVTDFLGPQAAAEIGLGRLARLDALEEIGQRVHERVLVADGAAGHPPFVHVGMLGVRDVDPLPAGQVVFDLLAGLRVGIAEVIQVLGVFQVEEDAARLRH